MIKVTVLLAAVWMVSAGSAEAQLREAARTNPAAAIATVSAKGHGPNAIAVGAGIGALVALGITAEAASSYGENETGRFCQNCFLVWSAITVPAGAAIGAGIGALVRSARHHPNIKPQPNRTVVAAPVLLRRGGGMFVTARF